MKRAFVLAVVLSFTSCGSRAAPDPAPATTPNGALPEIVEQAAPTPNADAEEDAELTRRIRRAFDADPDLAPIAERVTIVTIDSRVVLRGAVVDAAQRLRLTEAARGVSGVMAVEAQMD
ncbi:MAG TPA: BON domain-containing protein [Planctomycetota bacterium]|nr:BON domain-containing protein [Planctomycetota bacterium]